MDMFKYSQHKHLHPELFVEQLALKQYRNLEQINLTFSDGLHFFIGPNAQGKTNLLESLYVVAIGKSHRTRSHKELIRFGQSMAKIRLILKRGEHSERLEVKISPKGKKISKNGVEQRKLSQYIGTLPAIMFAPEDLELVKGGPLVRRKFLNMEIGQVSPRYLFDLSKYNQLIQQRNHLLKQEPQSKQYQTELLDVLDEQMIPIAVRIWKKRIGFLRDLNKWSCDIHQQISQQKERLHIHYQSSVPIETDMKEEEIQERFKQEIRRVRKKEVSRRVTLLGPHRDDIRVKLGEIDINTFGSQGQQRTVALSLKLAEIEYMYQKMGIYPILLLDDVLSELDDIRRNYLFRAIQGRVQTFVTTTGLDGIDTELVRNANVYHIKQGTIIEQG